MNKQPKKKDREYMAILDQPIEELKKPMGQSVNFDKVMDVVLGSRRRKQRRD